ncbi:MAG: IS5 family transposase [Candidatus Fimadaptatus sp.]
MAGRYEVTNAEWERIKDHLPPERSGMKGRPRIDNRKMLNGMLWIIRTGCQWREMPERYGKWQSVYSRFRKWQKDGTIEHLYRELSKDADDEYVCIDSTIVKVHESAHGGEKGGP